MRTHTTRRGPDPAAAARYRAGQQLADALRALPSRPLLLDAAIAHLAAGAPARGQEDMALRGYRNLRVALLGSLPASPELDLLWRSGVACGYYTAQLAYALGFELRDAAAAGLLHRAGECRLRVALAQLGAPFESRSLLEHDAELCQRLLGAWTLPASVIHGAAEWRTGGGNNLSRLVYLAHLLALGELDPSCLPPGVERAAALELGVDAALLDRLAAGRQNLLHWLNRT